MSRKISKTSKFFFFDIGVVRAILANNKEKLVLEDDAFSGIAFESVIYQELRAFSSYQDLDELCYFRTPEKQEVDFIFRGEIAIEVKLSKKIAPQDLKTLKLLLKEDSVKKAILVCREPRRREVSGVEIVPVGDFFAELWKGEI